ncbi:MULTISPECIES: hypothetical protein [Acinetobacter calcoaceticus/baumannii complex]|uniref:hypothetical protein n=1 Tax=Acinetobacter calcoaceticus/baumannii complex TaxID=909768 RepID=UPI00244D530F|nr:MULTISPECIES: hypothetical protein [Acinetobacter calcoaceticus/baumannii complex]MDH2595913.1 hypothetical protein [Acinetobacter baumannii]MDO7536712.1 hypothetical protein [Acinetobacter pittii]
MEVLTELLRDSGIRNALIVDDGYDSIPTAADLSKDEDKWTNFFDDSTSEDEIELSRIFSDYSVMDAEDLKSSDEFVGKLWNNKNTLRNDLIEPLFQRYIADMEMDNSYLKTVSDTLENIGLTVTTLGKNFSDFTGNVDLIIIDLFLGSGQELGDMDISIKGLKKLLKEKLRNPPLVILMSRSHRLQDKKEIFRDGVGLFESTFRILHKSDLIDSVKLIRVLNRLVKHYKDTRKIANFLSAWKDGLSVSFENTINSIRRLDLPELAQLNQLLLKDEGAPTGAYLVDIFDRVLLHELEAQKIIIDAANDLKTLTVDEYPPPYISGSKDLQSLVYCALFQHTNRLELDSSESLVAFGDILRKKANITDENPNIVLSSITSDQVLVVMTPACDLQRKGAMRVLFMVGDLKEIKHSSWPTSSPLVTTIFKDSETSVTYSIKWNPKHLEMLTHDEINKILSDGGDFKKVARLREIHAIELQQKLLADIGRVGLMAPSPATFPIWIKFLVPHTNGELIPLQISESIFEKGVCYIGREGDKNKRMILSEDTCDLLQKKMNELEVSIIHPKASNNFQRLKKAETFISSLEKGIKLPKSESPNWTEMPVDINPPVVALIGSKDAKEPLHPRELAKMGIAIKIYYEEPE